MGLAPAWLLGRRGKEEEEQTQLEYHCPSLMHIERRGGEITNSGVVIGNRNMEQVGVYVLLVVPGVAGWEEGICVGGVSG